MREISKTSWLEIKNVEKIYNAWKKMSKQKMNHQSNGVIKISTNYEKPVQHLYEAGANTNERSEGPVGMFLIYLLIDY